MNFENQCRLCNSPSNLEPVSKKIRENPLFLLKISECANIQLSESKEFDLNSTICNDCAFKIMYFFEFRHQCLQNDSAYKENFEKTDDETITIENNIFHDEVFMDIKAEPTEIQDKICAFESSENNHLEPSIQINNVRNDSELTKDEVSMNEITLKIVDDNLPIQICNVGSDFTKNGTNIITEIPLNNIKTEEPPIEISNVESLKASSEFNNDEINIIKENSEEKDSPVESVQKEKETVDEKTEAEKNEVIVVIDDEDEEDSELLIETRKEDVTENRPITPSSRSSNSESEESFSETSASQDDDYVPDRDSSIDDGDSTESSEETDDEIKPKETKIKKPRKSEFGFFDRLAYLKNRATDFCSTCGAYDKKAKHVCPAAINIANKTKPEEEKILKSNSNNIQSSSHLNERSMCICVECGAYANMAEHVCPTVWGTPQSSQSEYKFACKCNRKFISSVALHVHELGCNKRQATDEEAEKAFVKKIKSHIETGDSQKRQKQHAEALKEYLDKLNRTVETEDISLHYVASHKEFEGTNKCPICRKIITSGFRNHMLAHYHSNNSNDLS